MYMYTSHLAAVCGNFLILNLPLGMNQGNPSIHCVLTLMEPHLPPKTVLLGTIDPNVGGWFFFVLFLGGFPYTFNPSLLLII